MSQDNSISNSFFAPRRDFEKLESSMEEKIAPVTDGLNSW